MLRPHFCIKKQLQIMWAHVYYISARNDLKRSLPKGREQKMPMVNRFIHHITGQSIHLQARIDCMNLPRGQYPSIVVFVDVTCIRKKNGRNIFET